MGSSEVLLFASRAGASPTWTPVVRIGGRTFYRGGHPDWKHVRVVIDGEVIKRHTGLVVAPEDAEVEVYGPDPFARRERQRAFAAAVVMACCGLGAILITLAALGVGR